MVSNKLPKRLSTTVGIPLIDVGPWRRIEAGGQITLNAICVVLVWYWSKKPIFGLHLASLLSQGCDNVLCSKAKLGHWASRGLGV